LCRATAAHHRLRSGTHRKPPSYRRLDGSDRHGSQSRDGAWPLPLFLRSSRRRLGGGSQHLAALGMRRTHSAAAHRTAALRLACSSTQRRSWASPTNRVAINHRRQTLDQQRSTRHAAGRHANVICVNRYCAPPIHKCAPAPQRRQDGVHGPRLALASGAAAAAA